MKIIAFTGLARSGKDTATAMVLDIINNDATNTLYALRAAFGDPVKTAASETFNIPRKWFYDPALKERVHPFWGISPRTMMQKLGTEAVRGTFGDTFWCNRLEFDIGQGLYDCDVLVISDLRTDTEADWVKRRGGLIVEIVRVGAGLQGENAEHSSEAGIYGEMLDIVLYNNSTLDDLREGVQGVLEDFGCA